MKIAYLVDQFYSDNLQFLIELHKDHELILYNDIDLYGNKEMFPNIENRSIVNFIDDLIFNVFDKCYILYYDNLCMPKFLLNYKHKVIFFCHSQTHAIYLSSLGFNWISLLKKYNTKNYMHPITYNTIDQSQLINTQFDKRRSNGNIIKLCAIGNVNAMELVKLLDITIIQIYIFTLDSSDKPFLQQLQQKYPFRVTILDKKPTKEILEYINKHNIEFIVYSPLSENYKNEWPGTITFAYNHNIPLILLNEIIDLYKLEGCIASNNIIPNIQNYYDNIHEYTEKILDYKKSIYQRNKVVDGLFNGINENNYIDTEYGLLFGLKNDIFIQKITNKGYQNIDIINFICNSIKKDKDMILDIGSYIGATSLGILSKNDIARIISVEPQIFFAKLQKDTMLYNNYSDRIKVYNNAFGHKCISNISMSDELSQLDSLSNIKAKVDYEDKNLRNFGGLNIGKGGENIDMLSIDGLDIKNISVIKIDVEGMENLVIWGGRKTIMDQKPTIIYRKTWKSLTQDMIDMLKLSNKIISFNIDTFLVKCGYNQSKAIKIGEYIVWQI